MKKVIYTSFIVLACTCEIVKAIELQVSTISTANLNVYTQCYVPKSYSNEHMYNVLVLFGGRNTDGRADVSGRMGWGKWCDENNVFILAPGFKNDDYWEPEKWSGQALLDAFGETNDKAALFTGKPMVDGLGYAFLFRNYRPQNGKWLTADLIGYPDGWNNLAYCTNCPCMLVDTNGCFISFGFAAIGAALSSAGYVASSLLTGNEITTSGLIGAAAGGFTAGAIMGAFTTLDPSAGVVATGIMGAISAAGGKVVNNIVSNFSFQEVTDGVATAAIIGGIGAGIGSALNLEGLVNHAASFATGVVTDLVDYVYNTINNALDFLDETQQNRFNDVLGMISQFIVPSLMADDVVFDYSLHMLE